MVQSKMKNSRFAGELLVAAELTRCGYSVALHNSLGVNTPSFDMTAGTEEGRAVAIQVKALKSANAFLIDPEKIRDAVAYVFVIVGEAGTLPQFFVARGAQLLEREDELFGKWGRKYGKEHGRGIQSRRLPEEWRGNWGNLGLEPSPDDPSGARGRACSRCGGDDDLHLVTVPLGTESRAGRVLTYCPRCRGEHPGRFGVSIPLGLVTDELFVRLYEDGLTDCEPTTAAEIAFGGPAPEAARRALEALASSGSSRRR